MSVRCLQFAPLLAAVTLGVCLPVQGQQSLPARGQKIIFSDPKGDPVSSNLNAIATQKLNLKSLEDEFKKPFSLSGPGAAGSAAPLPLPHLPQPNLSRQQLRELFEKERDWIFQAPEDFESTLTAEKIFKVPEYDEDGQEKQKPGAVERFYQRLDEERKEITRPREEAEASTMFSNQESFGFASSRDLLDFQRLKPGSNIGSRTEGSSGLDGPNLSPEEIMRRLAGGNSGSRSQGALMSAEISGFFDAGKIELLPQSAAQQARMEEFKRLLEPRVGASSLGGEANLNLLNNAPSTSPSLATSSGLGLLPEVSGLNPSSPMASGMGAPQSPRALITAPPARPGFLPAESTLEPARTATPTPAFNLPKRVF